VGEGWKSLFEWWNWGERRKKKKKKEKEKEKKKKKKTKKKEKRKQRQNYFLKFSSFSSFLSSSLPDLEVNSMKTFIQSILLPST
jgi:negative regulator of genetic competence, sporulation and motility